MFAPAKKAKQNKTTLNSANKTKEPWRREKHWRWIWLWNRSRIEDGEREISPDTFAAAFISLWSSTMRIMNAENTIAIERALYWKSIICESRDGFMERLWGESDLPAVWGLSHDSTEKQFFLSLLNCVINVQMFFTLQLFCRREEKKLRNIQIQFLAIETPQLDNCRWRCTHSHSITFYVSWRSSYDCLFK